MTDRPPGEDDGLELFDLPLAPPATQKAVPQPAATAPQPPSPLVPPVAEPPEVQQTIELERAQPTVSSGPSSLPALATVKQRVLSGGADVLIHAGALATLALGLRLMAIEPRPGHWPALLLFLLAFSFLYTVVSLAFWGQTAGMAWFGLAARESQQFQISFVQAVGRWLGNCLTFALLGLPLLLLVQGSSLSDRMSRSRTFRAFPPAP